MSANLAETVPELGLSAEDFLKHMAAMQAHYTPGTAGSAKPKMLYHLPEHIVALAAKPPAGKPAAPQNVMQVVQRTEQETLAFVTSHEAAITKALTAPNTTAQFVKQMQVLEQQEIADHSTRLKSMFDGLIKAGQAHPGHQPQILTASNHMAGFMGDLLHEGHAVMHGVTTIIGGAAHLAKKAVDDAAHQVSTWASSAAKSVGHFFKSLF